MFRLTSWLGKRSYSKGGGAGTIQSNGKAAFTTKTLLTATSHTITATYTGATNLAASTSTPLVQTVSAAVTTTTLATSTLLWTLDQPIVFTAKVAAASGGVPTGSLTFTIDGTQTFTVALTAGAATLNFAGFTAAGMHTIIATYNPGTVNFATSSSNTSNSTLDRNVLLASSVTVFATPNPVTVGQVITLSTTITGSAGTPTGTVSFYDGAKLLQTLTLNGAGSASLTLALAVGTQDIIVTYSGDGTYNPATSKALAVVVKPLSALR